MATLKMNVNCIMIDDDREYCGFWKYVDVMIVVDEDDVEKVIKKIKDGCESDVYVNLDDDEDVIEYSVDGGSEYEVLEYDIEEGVEGVEICNVNDEIEVCDDEEYYGF